MNSYLLTLVLKPDLEEKARKELLDNVKRQVISDKGKVTREDLWGGRDLAYPIHKQTKAFYVHFEFETDPSIAKELDKTLKLEEDILRYLLVRAKIRRKKEKGKLKKTIMENNGI